MRRAFAIVGAAAWLSSGAIVHAGEIAPRCWAGSRTMARVELYFGAGHIPRARWTRFLAQVVTPRFPDGLTTLEGLGQWRGADGRHVLEPTQIVVVFYRRDATSDARIEAIRRIYKLRFHQQSVLRADTNACVSF